MPHIEDKNKPFYEVTVAHAPVSSGVLNYQLTMVVVAFLLHNGLNYATCNDIVGALDNCKDEFRRLVQHPYEDKKIEENGNAYPKEVLS